MQYNLVFKDNSSRKLNNLQASARDNNHTYLLCCTFKKLLSKSGLQVQNPLFVSKHLQKISLVNENFFLETFNKKMTFSDFLFANDKKKGLEVYQEYLFAQKDKEHQINLFFKRINFEIKKTIDFYSKNLYRLNNNINKTDIYDSKVTFEKYIRKYSFDILENLSFGVNLIGISLKKDFFAESYDKKILISQDRISLFESHDKLCYKKNVFFAESYNKKILINQNEISLFKSLYGLCGEESSLSLGKRIFNFKYSNNDIYISKKVANLNYTNLLSRVKTQYKDINIDKKSTKVNANKTFKSLHFAKNLFINTDNKPIDFINFITINDYFKEIFFDNNKWLSSINKEIYIHDTIQVKKNLIDIYKEYNKIEIDAINKNVYLNDFLEINKNKAYKANINASEILQLEQNSRGLLMNKYLSVSYEYRDLLINKYLNVNYRSRDLLINKYLNMNYRSRDTTLKNTVTVDVPHRDTTKKTNSQDVNVDYIKKDIRLSEYKKPSFRDNFEFVTVIQGQWDNFDEDGGVDELLLPHKDYDYTHFLKEMINEDGTIKSEYITGYDHDKMQYRVKLPIENPVQIYNLLGREYLDLDVGFLSYFMTVLKARWRDKMYTYAAMNSLDAITDMLEYLHHFFYTKYSKDEEKLAYTDRCLQLFRWYSEMAILNNSEYQLEFATKKIQVDYYNKTLNDFENMVIMNNMQISDNFILEPIDMTLPCNIIFVNTKKDIMPKLKLHFKLYNVNNQSSILIIDNDNNVTETNYNSGIHELDLELENKIEIKFEPTDINQTIAITSTDISNMPTRNFTLRYCGRVGEVNPILKEVCNMLLIDSEPEISDDNKKIVEDIAPATAAIYQMVRYYDMHHREKKKGKRLTIKK